MSRVGLKKEMNQKENTILNYFCNYMKLYTLMFNIKNETRKKNYFYFIIGKWSID